MHLFLPLIFFRNFVLLDCFGRGGPPALGAPHLCELGLLLCNLLVAPAQLLESLLGKRGLPELRLPDRGALSLLRGSLDLGAAAAFLGVMRVHLRVHLSVSSRRGPDCLHLCRFLLHSRPAHHQHLGFLELVDLFFSHIRVRFHFFKCVRVVRLGLLRKFFSIFLRHGESGPVGARL